MLGRPRAPSTCRACGQRHPQLLSWGPTPEWPPRQGGHRSVRLAEDGDCHHSRGSEESQAVRGRPASRVLATTLSAPVSRGFYKTPPQEGSVRSPGGLSRTRWPTLRLPGLSQPDPCRTSRDSTLPFPGGSLRPRLAASHSVADSGVQQPPSAPGPTPVSRPLVRPCDRQTHKDSVGDVHVGSWSQSRVGPPTALGLR